MYITFYHENGGKNLHFKAMNVNVHLIKVKLFHRNRKHLWVIDVCQHFDDEISFVWTIHFFFKFIVHLTIIKRDNCEQSHSLFFCCISIISNISYVYTFIVTFFCQNVKHAHPTLSTALLFGLILLGQNCFRYDIGHHVYEEFWFFHFNQFKVQTNLE